MEYKYIYYIIQFGLPVAKIILCNEICSISCIMEYKYILLYNTLIQRKLNLLYQTRHLVSVAKIILCNVICSITSCIMEYRYII